MAEGRADPDVPPRVFISYRRDDAAAHAGRLYDALVDRFGRDCVFMDVDSIQVGTDFTQVVEEAIAGCDAVVAVLGPSWLSATDSKGRRRLDNPDDLVRLELEIALERNARILPVLVQGADMPASDELPPSLSRLVRRHAFDLADRRWRSDILDLISALEGLARQQQAVTEEKAREEAHEQARLEAEAENQARLQAEAQAGAEAEARLEAEAAEGREQARLEAEAQDQAPLEAAEAETGRQAEVRRDAGTRLEATPEEARRQAEPPLPVVTAKRSTRGRRIVLISGVALILDLLFVKWQHIAGVAGDGSSTGVESPNALPGVLAFLITLGMVGQIMATKVSQGTLPEAAVLVGTEATGAEADRWASWGHLVAGLLVLTLLLVKLAADAIELGGDTGAIPLGAETVRLIVVASDGSLTIGAYLGPVFGAALAFGGFSMRRASTARRSAG